MIETIELMPGATLRCCPDRRFKQGGLSLQLVRPMCREEAGLNALIPAVLLRGSEDHPDLRSITLKLDELYGASVSTLVRRIGDYQTTGLFCGFMDDRFALPGDKVMEPMLMFLGELLLSPCTRDGAFLPEIVESEKKNLIATIESERNDKRAYAMAQLFRAMCREDSYGIPRLGEKEQVAAITPRALYDHYQKILKESRIELFYVGSAPAERVAALVKPVLEQIQRNYVNIAGQKPFSGSGEGQTITERMEVTQAKLCMGFVTPITNRQEEFASMQVFNTLFGAGMTSKLFMNVREKLSLCYHIGSAYYGSKGIVTVSAGIDADQEENARNEILRQLAACRSGEITDEELSAAREALLSALRSTHDSPGAIESYYSTAAISGMGMTPERYADAVRAVTREQVAAAARSMTLHTTYILKGAAE